MCIFLYTRSVTFAGLSERRILIVLKINEIELNLRVLAMVQDKRYSTVKYLIDSGYITSFSQIFESIPMSVVANDTGSNYVRFKRLAENPTRFRLKDLVILAKLIGIPEMKIISLIMGSPSKNKRKK